MEKVCFYCNKKLKQNRYYLLFCSRKCRIYFLYHDIKTHPYWIKNRY